MAAQQETGSGDDAELPCPPPLAPSPEAEAEAPPRSRLTDDELLEEMERRFPGDHIGLLRFRMGYPQPASSREELASLTDAQLEELRAGVYRGILQHGWRRDADGVDMLYVLCEWAPSWMPAGEMLALATDMAPANRLHLEAYAGTRQVYQAFNPAGPANIGGTQDANERCDIMQTARDQAPPAPTGGTRRGRGAAAPASGSAVHRTRASSASAAASQD